MSASRLVATESLSSAAVLSTLISSVAAGSIQVSTALAQMRLSIVPVLCCCFTLKSTSKPMGHWAFI